MTCSWLYLTSRTTPERFCGKPGIRIAWSTSLKWTRWNRPIRTGMKSCRRTGPSAKRSQKKGTSYRREQLAARLIPIVSIVRNTARMIRWEF